MENVIVRIARNDDFKVVGYSVMVNNNELFNKGCTTSCEFYYVKNVRVNAETFAKIVSLHEGARMMEKAANDFFKAFKAETLEVLNKAAKKSGNEGINGFNLSMYTEPKERMENELDAIISNLK